MPPKTEQVPGAIAGAEQSPLEAAASSEALTGAELAAAFRRTRPARRPSDPAPVIEEEEATPQEPANETGEEAPATDPDPGATDGKNAASTPTGEETEETEGTEQTPPEEENEGIKGLKKRVDTLTARSREVERERDDLKTATQQLQAAKPAPVGEFGHDEEMAGYNAEMAKWSQLQSWLRENPQSGEMTDAKGAVIRTITEEQTQEFAQQSADALNQLKTQRAVRSRELKKSDAELRRINKDLVKTTFPWARDEKSNQNEFIRPLEQQVPENKRMPGWKPYAAHAIDGLMRANAKTAGKPAAVAAWVPKVGIPGSAGAQRVDPLQEQLAEAEATFDKSGTQEDLQPGQILRRKVRAAQRTGWPKRKAQQVNTNSYTVGSTGENRKWLDGVLTVLEPEERPLRPWSTRAATPKVPSIKFSRTSYEPRALPDRPRSRRAPAPPAPPAALPVPTPPGLPGALRGSTADPAAAGRSIPAPCRCAGRCPGNPTLVMGSAGAQFAAYYAWMPLDRVEGSYAGHDVQPEPRDMAVAQHAGL